MPASLSRRKKGLILGLTLMSAAALVAFGTARYSAAKRQKADEAGEEAEATGEATADEEQEPYEPTLWEKIKEVGQGVFLLFSNRKLRS